ncbi:hypothetical protein HG531_001027 [Fusarium graminearum]|nr:hypothetical protein HG531_001027 [Fusarium graminearum]
MRINFVLLETLLRDNDLSSTSNPVTVTAVAGVLAITEVDTVSFNFHITNFGIPFVAPRIGMVMSRKETDDAGCRDQSLHQQHVLVAVVAASFVFSAPSSALLDDGFVINSRVVVLIDTRFLLEL